MINPLIRIEMWGVVVLVGCLFFLMLDRIGNRDRSLRPERLPRSGGEVTVGYCSKCGQRSPKPWFRIVNGPAALLFVWPAIDLLAYGLIPTPQLFSPHPNGAVLAVGAVLTTAVYAWIALSGR